MNTINTKGLMLGMLAIGGLIAGGAMLNGQAYAQVLEVSPINAASASNSDDDVVVQSNEANVAQSADVECEAKVSDDDKKQKGDSVNAAANDCDTTQTATVAQVNSNTDNDVQVAEADACQSVALGAAANLCDNVIDVEALGGVGDLLDDLLGGLPTLPGTDA
jgi:hypothetical protein